MENIYLIIVLSPLIASIVAGFFGRDHRPRLVTPADDQRRGAISCVLSVWVL